MKDLHIDFAGIMDHRQVRHMYLEDFDLEYFLYGSEPLGEYIEPHLMFHYIMIFKERDTLEKILEKFPDVFEFTGGVEGHFVYKPVEFDRFMEVLKAVRDIGGAFVYAHPINYDEDTKYRVDVITDKGLAYSAPLTIPFSVAINVEKRRFYRVEIIREEDGSPAAIGNPIWIED